MVTPHPIKNNGPSLILNPSSVSLIKVIHFLVSESYNRNIDADANNGIKHTNSICSTEHCRQLIADYTHVSNNTQTFINPIISNRLEFVVFFFRESHNSLWHRSPYV